MQLNMYRPAELRIQLQRAHVRNDKLELFVLGNARDELEAIHESNFKIALDVANDLKLDYVYFGVRDLAGCRQMRTKTRRTSIGGEPTIWLLADALGIKGGCGNTDQYQIDGYHRHPDLPDLPSILCNGYDYFGPDNIGAWDIPNRQKLTVMEEYNKAFAYVSERDQKRKEYAKYTPLPRRPAYAW